MSPERWKKLEEICHAAWMLKPSQRRAFLDQACASDEELRREAESLLAADGAAADDFLQSGAFTLGMQALADQETRRDEMNAATTEVFEIEVSVGMILDGRYEILAALDAGGMGEVYQARDRRLNRLVVVKVLKKKSRKNPWTVRKFRDEGEAQGRIHHPNVATVLDTGALPSGEQYLVMEFIDGRTLRQIIKDRQIALPEAAEIIKQAGRAVAAIHNARLIHRDLKPENIMVYHEAETGEFVVKVIDFGIVRDLDKSTVVGQIIGTPLYMSPEQLDGKEATAADDVYALGEIAYEMLTGNHPFKPEDLAHLLKLKQEEVKVKPSALRPGLPQAAEDLILAALSPKANKRQSSAHAFGDDLARKLTPPPPPPPSKFNWRIIITVAAAIVFATAIVSVLWWYAASPIVPRLAIYWHGFGHRKQDAKWSEFTIRGDTTLYSRDQFRLVISPNEDCYAYIIGIQANGDVVTHFPGKAIKMGNRLQRGKHYEIPDGVNWFTLDADTGTETLYFLASYDPLDSLDRLVSGLSANSGSASLREQLQTQINALADIPDPSATTLRTRSGKIMSRGIEVKSDNRPTVATLGDGQREEQAMQFELGDVNLVKRIQIRHELKPLGRYAAEQKKTRGIGIEPEREKSLNFAVNSANIDLAGAKSALEDLHRKITASDRKGHVFLIAGHADQRGGHETNDRLSQARADAVRRVLISNYGIPCERLVTYGYGKRQLLDPSNNEVAWEINRRVELWDLTVIPNPYPTKISPYRKGCE